MSRTDGYGDYPDLSGVNRVLVVKLRQHGDVLLTSPLFGVLRRALPSVRIDALVYRDTAPMLEGHPDIRAVHTYDRSRLSRLDRLMQELTLVRTLRAQGYDLIFNLTDGDRGALTAWIAGARVRVGLDPLGQGMAFKRRLYTHVVKRARTPRHMVEQQLDALRRIGIFPSQEERDLALAIPRAAQDAVEAHLRAAALTRSGFVLIHPTSRWLFKSWPTDRLAALVRILDGLGWRIVLSGAPDPRELAVVEDIVKQATGVNVVNLAGRLTLKELGALIAASRCLVCMDSVPMHMASALKHPVVALFGPSSDRVWGPWRNPFGRVVSLDYSCRPCNLDGCGGSKVSDCLHSLPVDAVVQAVREVARPSA